MKKSRLSMFCLPAVASLVCSSLVPAAVAADSAAQDTPYNSSTVNISDPQATAETQALFAALRDTSSKDIRFGHQQTTELSITGAKNGDVYDMTGKYPAVFGFDAGEIVRASNSEADPSAAIEKMVNDIKFADAQGGMITLSIHWNNPCYRKGLFRHH